MGAEGETSDATPMPFAAARAVDALDLAPTGVIQLDALLVPSAANRAALSLLGLTPERFAALPGSLLRSLVDTAMCGTAAETAPSPVAFRHVVRPDGSNVWLRVECAATDDGCLLFLTDATAQHRLEQELRAAAAGVDQLVRHAPLALSTVDLNGRVTVWNPASARLMDRDANAVTGSHITGALGASADALVAELAQAGRGEEPDPVEIVGHRADGTPCRLAITISPLRTGSRTNGALLIAEDVTAEREALEAEQAGSSRLRKILQNINDTISLIDRNGQLQGGTGQVSTILGYPPSFWTDANLIDIIHPGDTERALRLLGDALGEPGRRVTGEFRVRDVDDNWIIAEGTAANLLDDPDVGAILLTTRNVTERKRTELLVTGQAEILRQVAQGAPLRDTLAALNELVERQSPRARCGIRLQSDGGVLETGGLDQDLLASVSDALLDHGAGRRGAERRLAAPALESGSDATSNAADPIVAPRLADLPALAPRRGALEYAGWIGAWAVPIRSARSTDLLGSLTCVYDTVCEPGAGELELARVAADLAAIAAERERDEQRLARLAMHDELTGLANRHLLANRLELALSRAQRHGQRLALMFLDLDRFKLINDSLGHDAGDAVLREFGSRLAMLVRPEDTIARIGGDEFVVLIEQVRSDHDIARVAERLERALQRPFLVGDGELFITASVGFALSDGADATAAELLRDADIAMYRAKQRGRNRVEIFDETLRTQLVDRLRMENDLRRALERGELAVHYRPSIDLASGRIVALEALLQWHHPELGAVEPARFLQVAEETGLIVSIGDWAIGEAVAAVSSMAGEPASQPMLALNLSARQAAQPDLVPFLRSTLANHGLAAERVIVELTEQALPPDTEISRANLRQLAEIGVSLAIDDFGTGHSSLSLLHQLPVSLVKIDRSFVADLEPEGSGVAVVRAVLAMAHALGIAVVAEGVEEASQLGALRALGCDRAQGDAVLPLLARHQLAEHLLR